jgi:hypothetical protein
MHTYAVCECDCGASVVDGTRVCQTRLSTKMLKSCTWHATACCGTPPLTDNGTCKFDQYFALVCGAAYRVGWRKSG